VRRFYGLGNQDIPAAMDLRAQGWRLIASVAMQPETWAEFSPEHPIILNHGALESADWRHLNGPRGAKLRRWAIVLGVEDGEERARLLRKGFGEVLPPGAPLAELAERATRLRDNALALRRFRRHGGLRLDLLDREAYVRGQPLGLHPREFAVLWRLMDAPEVPVEKLDLLRDVWRMAHVPETNSVAVHVSRLRAKLATVGLGEVIESTPGGGYCLVRMAASD